LSTIALTNYWIPLRFHQAQHDLWNCKAQFIAAVAGRGSGKTELARRKTVMSLAIKKEWPNPIYAYCLPTFAQAKRVAWKPLLNLIPKNWVKKNGINVSDMSIETVFGSTLYVVGMDKPQRIEGLQVDGVVLDESSDQRPGTFDLSIIPMLIQRKGWCWRIGVPKRSGIGRSEFKAFFEKGLENGSSFWWKSVDILSEEALEAIKESMDQQDYLEQFEASWIDLGGTIYYAFNPKENVSDEVHYDPIHPIYVGMDFNVDPMSWCLGHFINRTFRVFDEIFIRNANTESTLRSLASKYENHSAGWKLFGDASSRQRKTVTTRTDYVIIKNFTALLNKMVYFPQKNPPLKSRFTCVNANLCNAKGERRIVIHPRCKHLINDLNSMAYKEGTTEPEDYRGTDIGHMSDALGYIMVRISPIKLVREATPMVVSI
jgi:hypothetical protein